MKVATVLDSSLPSSMVRKHKGMISVVSRKLMTSVSSTCAQISWTQKGGWCMQQQAQCKSRARLDQGADDAQAGQAQVLEWPVLAGGVEEGVQEERDVSCTSVLSEHTGSRRRCVLIEPVTCL